MKILTKICSLGLLLALTAFGAGQTNAQPVNLNHYITLTVKKGVDISLDLKAEVANTFVKIMSGTKTYNVTLGTSWIGFKNYHSDGTTMTVYGDLVGFDCKNNGENVTALDVSKNTNLTFLCCSKNQLTSLDVSKNTNLTNLYCYENQLSHLDLTFNTALTDLYASGNVRPVVFPCAVSSLPGFVASKVSNVTGGKLTDGVFTPNSGSKEISYTYKMAEGKSETFKLTDRTTNMNQYITLTVKSGVDIHLDLKAEAASTGIKIVSGTKTYDVTVGTSWTGSKKYLSDGTIMTVYGNIVGFDCKNNGENVTALDVSKNTVLQDLDCSNNKITTLDVSKNTALQKLYCGYNQLTTLDVSKNTALTELNCSDNKITTLDVSKNTALEQLTCGYNQLTTLDVSKNTALTELNCDYNKLTTLDVSKNTALTELKCEWNQLTTLDVSKNTKLEALYCDDNHLSHLDLTANTALEFHRAKGNVHPVVFPCAVSNLPGFDVSKVSDVTGGTLSGGVFTTNPGSKTISYLYHVMAKGINPNYPDGKTETFKLTGPTVDKEHYITLTVKDKAEIKLQFLASSVGTGVKIVSGTKTYDVTVGTEWTVGHFISDGTTMTVYGNIKGFCCWHNTLNVTGLDLSNNTGLTDLYCSDNQLTSLDVSQNTNLKWFSCFNNQLTSLDVSKNSALKKLECEDNKLTTLDLSQNTALTKLNCSNNQLTLLDVTKNTALEKLHCKNNHLSHLDLTANTALTETDFDASGNVRPVVFPFEVNRLPGFDVEKMSEIAGGTLSPEGVFTADAGSTEISYTYQMRPGKTETFKLNGPTVNKDRYITLTVQDTAEIDLRLKAKAANTGIKIVSGTKTYDVTVGTDEVSGKYLSDGNTMTVYGDLSSFDCAENNEKVTALDPSRHTGLKNLNCTQNQLTTLDVSQNTGLVNLYCKKNLLTSLDVSNNVLLDTLYLVFNRLTSLDLSHNTALKYLNCYENQLTSLDVTQNTLLTELWCSYNPLTSLDVTKNTELKYLYCDNNQLTSLDVSNNTKLIIFSCSDNKLTTLDVSKNSLLQFNCSYNQLTSLDVTKHTYLRSLRCDKNQLSHLDLTTNTKLLKINASGNVHEIPNNLFPIADLPAGFDKGKCTEIVGGEFTAEGQVNITAESGMMSYKYEMASGKSETFSISLPRVTITFNPNGGTGKMSAVKTLRDSLYTLPPCTFIAPEGMEFDQWDKGAVDTKITVSEDITLIAQWKGIRYTVKFDANEGTGTMADQEFTYNTPQALSANTFSRSGFTFRGWNTSADGTGDAYADQATVNNLTTVANGVVTLYAQWEAQVTVTFAPNGGTGTMAPVKVDKGSEYVLPKCTFTAPKNMEFASWDKGAEGTKITVNGDVTLTALWKAVIVTITFNPGDGTGSMPPVKVEKGSDYTLPGCKFTAPEGKEFDKWDKGEVGMKLTVNDDVTITALWKEKVVEMVTISFDANGGTGTMDPVKVEKGSNYTLPGCGFTPPEGMVFSQWDKGKAGASIKVTKDLTIKAKWEKRDENKALISFAPGEGSGTMAPVQAAKNSKYTLPPSTFVAPMFKEFDRWDAGQVGESIQVTGDTTITALWKEQSTAVDVDRSTELTVYPNPVSNLLNIKGVDMKSVSLYDMLGRLVTVRPADSATATVLNVNSYQKGVYLVRIELNNGHFVTRKILINK